MHIHMSVKKHIHSTCLITYNQQEDTVTKILDFGVGQTGVWILVSLFDSSVTYDFTGLNLSFFVYKC